VAVKKGEQLTTTYTNTLRTTLERRRHLKQTKIFDCDCNRCCDSTELSTHGSAWICSSCGGLVESKNSLNNESLWECGKCKLQFSVEVKSEVKLDRNWEKAIFHMNFIRLQKKIAFPFSIFERRSSI
jgi:ribosomal protein S27AE